MSIRYLFLVIFLFLAFNCLADDPFRYEYKPDEILVRFAPKAKGLQRSVSEKAQILQSENCGQINRSYKIVPGLTHVKLPKGLSVQEALKKLNKRKDIIGARPNYKIYLLSTFPNDPGFSNLWGLHNTGQYHPLIWGGTAYGTEDADIDAPEAWDIHTDASNVIVAVIDSGIDYNHPDLAANIWVNQAELVGDPNSDDDSNGYIDDIYGYDFADQDSDPNDYYLHGTHVAGTVGAVGNNNIGVAGVCWNVKLMDVKIFPNYGEESFIDKAIAGIEYAIDNGAKILNNSWGGGPPDLDLYNAIKAAEAAGVLFIASAGNDGTNNEWTHCYPSDYDCENIISVLATNSSDEKPYWSNYGIASVDIGAPGEDIFSTFPTCRTLAFYDLEWWYERPFSTSYETIGGTSMAAPHVAGACALVWSMYPHLQYNDVKRIILESADKLPSLDNLCTSEGRLNLYQALLHAHPLDLAIEDNIADPDGCVLPDDEITFTITYGNPTLTNPADPNYWGPACDTQIHFPLPSVVDYVNINDPNYSIYDRTYIWNIGTINPGDSNSVSLTVSVNQNAEPLGKIESKARMYSSIGYGEADEETRICCWGGDRIYVNAYANGYETGQSWENAYKDLQQAMERSQKSCGDEIWVARGIYTPTKTGNQNASFDIVNGLKLYGGFIGGEDALQNRDFVSCRTYLSGNIDVGGDQDSYIVVNTAPGIAGETVIDGFVIAHSTVAGIKCNRADLTIQNCAITDNDANGINVYKSSPSIFDSIIANNRAAGVYDCNESNVMIDGCIISQNGGSGVYCTKSARASITSTWIHNNKLDGITFNNAASGVLVRNNTIVYNKRYGINLIQGCGPTITNSIVWDNAAGDIPGCNATYSCFDYGHQGLGNINYAPYFAGDPNSYNYHLHLDSPCRDAGDSGYYPGWSDIDSEPRVCGVKADMGADEVCSCDEDLSLDDIYYQRDLNCDGAFGNYEFGVFSFAWLTHDPNDPALPTDPNDPGYINDPDVFDRYRPVFDYNSDYAVDVADLDAFAGDWLWQACWRRTDKWLFTFGNVQGDTDDMQQVQQMSSVAGGAQMVSASTMEEEMLSEQPAQTETAETAAAVGEISEKSIAEQIADLQDAIGILETIWQDDDQLQQEIQPADWQDFMDSVYQSLTDLQAENAQTE